MTTLSTTLLFDLDGTLTDNYPGIARSIVHALDCLGVEAPHESVLRRCVGPSLRESFRWLLDTDDSERIEHAIGLYRDRFGEVGWRENVVYDGIGETLADLDATGARMFLCTAKPEVFARRIVTLFGFSAYLDGVYGADLAGAFDDKVKLLAHLAQRERIDTTHAVMIGDRSHDIRAARMNGARSIGVLWGYGTREELVDAGADAVVATPRELVECIAAMRG